MNVNKDFLVLVSFREMGRGIRRAISRSNKRNSMAIRKNRKEKGRRGDFIGSKPHS